jgi:hypothetical protein
VNRRHLITGLPAIWLSAPAVAKSTVPVETLETMLEKLRHRIEEDMPDLTDLQITYDPKNVKVPLMVVALRV